MCQLRTGEIPCTNFDVIVNIDRGVACALEADSNSTASQMPITANLLSKYHSQ
jgi:hypothetical protein